MWNTLEQVAKTNLLPVADFVEFSISRDNTYKIKIENGESMVSNLHVESLIKDFENFQEEQAHLCIEHMCDTSQIWYRR